MADRFCDFGLPAAAGECLSDSGLERVDGHALTAEVRIRQSHCALTALRFAALIVVLSFAGATVAQDVAMPGMDPYEVGSTAPPVSNYGEGSYFSQDLGTLLRVRFNSESYGQNNIGNLDLGTMQVANFDDAIAFLDAQVTLNDEQGVGFNVGLGYRWMQYSPYNIDAQRVNGWSVWADGTSTKDDGFFPQVGVSFESLGELWDLRTNGYIPVGQESQVGEFQPTGVTNFQSNFISEITQAVVNTSFFAGDLEVARRLGAQRDAWAFGGPYFLANSNDDTVGYRAGVRGYAYSDLLLQFAVTHDEIFNTNATFSLVWFVGRTRTNFRPACSVADRFREPVLRNDYVALAQSTVTSGVPLTDTDGNPIRVVHVDSNAPAGGDGTFEHPLNNLNNILGNSQTGDIVFAHAESQFTGQAAVLQDNQRFLGEGNNLVFTVTTEQSGTLNIPESSPGARAGTRPQILSAPGDAITMADNNEIANFDIDGQAVTARGIAPQAAGAGVPIIHDLSIKNTTGDGIAFTPFTLTDTDDLDQDGNTTEQVVRGNVTISKVTFDNIGGDDIDINSLTATDVTDPNVTLQESISIADVTSTNGKGAGVRLANTHDAHTATITNYKNGTTAVPGSGGGLGGILNEGVLRFEDITGDLAISNANIQQNRGFAVDLITVDMASAVTIDNLDYDGGAGVAGGIRADLFNGTLTTTNSTLTNGTLAGVSLRRDSSGTFNFNATNTFTSIDGTAFEIDGGGASEFAGTVSMLADIVNDTGRSVVITGMKAGATATFAGDIMDDTNGTGIFIHDNVGGSALFTGASTLVMTGNNAAVTLTNNTGATIDFGGLLDITTANGIGFDATGGGTLTADNTTNKITTATGQIARITGMAIPAADRVIFGNVDRGPGSTFTAIDLENNTGGAIAFGTVTDLAGDSGTIQGGTLDAIVIKDSANVTISGLKIVQSSAVSGVVVDKLVPAMTVNLNDLEITGGDIGIEMTGHNNANNLTMTVNDVDINSTTALGLSIDGMDHGTINFNNLGLDGNNVAGTGGGVKIADSNANITFDADTTIQEFNGTDFEVFGGVGTGTISMAGDIANSSVINSGDTSGRSLHLHGITAGTVTFTSTNAIVDNNEGMLVENNLGTATINLLGTHTLNTAGVNTAVRMNNNAGTTISIGQLDITTAAGNGFEATNGGTLSVTGFGNKVVTTGGRGLFISGMTIGSVDFESVTATGGDNGIRLLNNTTGVITVGDTGNAVDQGGIIKDTTNEGVFVQNSNVNLNGVTVQNAGDVAGENAVRITHTNATTMNVNLNRLTVDNTTPAVPARAGVLIDGTGGSGTFNANIQNLNLDATGNGLDVNDGVTLTAGGTNTIDVVSGVGLGLSDITIASGNANFDHVTVTAGTSNGIVMQNVASSGGGQVQVGTVGGATNSGGVMTTASDAIVLSNVQNADLRHIQILNSTAGDGVQINHTSTATSTMDITIDDLNLDAASAKGINLSADNDSFSFALRLTNSDIANADVLMDVTGAGQFGLLVQNTKVNQDAVGRAFDLQFHDGATDGDVTIRGDSRFTAADGEGLFVDSFDATPKDIKMLIEDSRFTDTAGAELAADINSRGTTLFQATIQGNFFTSAGAPHDMAVRSNGTAAAQMQLLLGGDVLNDSNNNSALGQGTLFVEQTGTSLFGIFMRDPTIVTDVRNNQPVDSSGTFQNLGTAPALPIVP